LFSLSSLSFTAFLSHPPEAGDLLLTPGMESFEGTEVTEVATYVDDAERDLSRIKSVPHPSWRYHLL
jgi:hypothetical protein